MASVITSQLGDKIGGSGGGGHPRGQIFSAPSGQPTAAAQLGVPSDRSTYSGSTTPGSSSALSSVSKIVATQIFLLLGSITDKEGKAKWETQADAIRKVSVLE